MSRNTSGRSEGDELTVRAARANAGAQEAYKLLLPVLEKVLIESSAEDIKPYALKHRIKQTSSIKEKVERKRSESKRFGDTAWHYEPEHVTDAVGFRIVTKFLQHIPLAVSTIIELIRHNSVIASPFKKDGLKELVIYTSRPDGDPLSINDDILGLVKKYGFEAVLQPPETKKSGYSSVHLVAYVPVHFKGPDGKNVDIDFTVEIQIRDIFEEAWCETEHALRYIPQRGGSLDPSDPQIKTWMPYLNALKTSLDGASQQASIIFNNAIASRKIADSPTRTDSRPADSAASARSILQSVLPTDMHELLTNAFLTRENAERSHDEKAKKDLFLKAALAFDELYKIAEKKNILSAKVGNWDVDYGLAMEDAYCRTLGSDDDFDRISSIYERIISKYPNDTVALYRHARLMRLPDIDMSISYFKRAMETLSTDSAISSDHWLHAAVPRNLAFAIWFKSKSISSLDEKGKLLRSAITYCYEAKSKSEFIADSKNLEGLKATNSWVYYILELAKIDNSARPELSSAVASLEEFVQKKSKADLETTETLAAAWFWLENRDKARRYASELASRLFALTKGRMDYTQETSPENSADVLTKMKEFLRGGELDAYNTALTILFGSALRPLDGGE